jgi:L,D-transpeptidase catalytic domain
LGTLHNPMYFYKGWAIHGSPRVPAYAASHGCVRISNADADWLFPLVPIGTPVVIYDTTGKVPGPNKRRPMPPRVLAFPAVFGAGPPPGRAGVGYSDSGAPNSRPMRPRGIGLSRRFRCRSAAWARRRRLLRLWRAQLPATARPGDCETRQARETRQLRGR